LSAFVFIYIGGGILAVLLFSFSCSRSARALHPRLWRWASMSVRG